METQNKTASSIDDFTPVEACNLTSKEQIKRYKELKDHLFKKIADVKELPEGYDLIFRENIEFSNQLVEFVNFERVCCPSFTFAMKFDPNGGPIHLEIKGSKGIKDMIAFGLKEYNQLKN
jgi:hypothetical protein